MTANASSASSDARLAKSKRPASHWWGNRLAHWNSSFGRTPTSATEVELVQRRIYLLPTGRGFFLIITAVVLLLVGVNYQLSLAYVVAFLLAGLMQAALLTSYRNLRGLIVASGRSPHGRVGNVVSFPITLASPERAREGITLASQSSAKQWAHSGPSRLSADERQAVPLSFVAEIGRAHV